MGLKLKNRVLQELNKRLTKDAILTRTEGDFDTVFSVIDFRGTECLVPGTVSVFQRALITNGDKEYIVLWFYYLNSTKSILDPSKTTGTDSYIVYLNEVCNKVGYTPFEEILDHNEYEAVSAFIKEHNLDRLDTSTEVPYLIEQNPLRFREV